MSELHTELLKLAHEAPELRRHILPLLREAAKPLEEQQFRNPETGKKVNFKSLPPEEQKKIREKHKDTKKEPSSDSKKPDFSELADELEGDLNPRQVERFIKHFKKEHGGRGGLKDQITRALESAGVTRPGAADDIMATMRDIDKKSRMAADLLKLAQDVPELRCHLIPILKEARGPQHRFVSDTEGALLAAKGVERHVNKAMEILGSVIKEVNVAGNDKLRDRLIDVNAELQRATTAAR